MIIEGRAIDTQQEAFFIKKLVGNAPSILVTNANHMYRASKYFEKEGLNITQAKTGFYDKNNHNKINRLHAIVPNTQKLTQSSSAMYERIGQLWQRFK